MNLQISRQSEVLANLNKSLADELNQPTSFPNAHSNKKIRKTNKAQNQINPAGWAFKKPGLF